MKRFLQLTLIIALAVGAVSCKKDEIINTVKEAPKDSPTVKNLPPKQKITLSASSTKPGLRIAYDASKGTDVTDDNTLWQEGDEIVVYNVGVNDEKAVFTLVEGAGTSYGTFVGTIAPTGNYYGVYPASAAGDLDGTSIAITLPDTQTYAEGSFGRNAAVFAATSTTEGDDVVLHFEPLLGYLSLSLTTPSNTTRDASSIVGGHSVGSIVLHENSLGGVALSGNATVDMSSADYEHNIPPTLSAAQGGGLDVTLDCGSGGVQLGSDPVEFIIAVPVGALSKGLCATVNDISGNKIMSLATTASNTITANYITQLPAQDVYNMEDIVGNRYPVSKIGPNIWMGENLRCLTYDTESGVDNNTIKITHTVINGNQENPCYNDPADMSYWIARDPETNAPWNLYIESVEDRNNVAANKGKFGYLYNWAATVGLSKEDSQASEGFDSDRQGICPNGWHIPAWNEFFYNLSDYVVGDLNLNGGYSMDKSGKFLKTVEGWSSYTAGGAIGTDDFGFSALPAGCYATKPYFEMLGAESHFWTSSLFGAKTGAIFIAHSFSDEFWYWANDISICNSVRCLKN